MPTLLSSDEIQARLDTLADWTLEGKSIQMILTFKNFIEAIDYVNKVVEPAEAAGHHPDISISYNRVIISLTTHDTGGLTQQDFAMAKTLSALS